jgi:hypothetical protein
MLIPIIKESERILREIAICLNKVRDIEAKKMDNAAAKGEVFDASITSWVQTAQKYLSELPSQLALLEGLKKEVEGMIKIGQNGEGLPFENSPDIYGNARMKAYKNGFNSALSQVIQSLEESITYLKNK